MAQGDDDIYDFADEPASQPKKPATVRAPRPAPAARSAGPQPVLPVEAIVVPAGAADSATAGDAGVATAPQPVLPATSPAAARKAARKLAYANRATARNLRNEDDASGGLHFPDRRRDLIWPLIISVIGMIGLFLPGVRFGVVEALVLTSAYLLVKYLIMLVICWVLGFVLHFSFGSVASASLKVLAIVTATDGWLFGCIAIDSACGGFLLGLLGSVAVLAACLWKLTDLEADEIAMTTALYWFPSLIFSYPIFSAAAWLSEWVI